jgi:hypothetical protein
VIFTTVVLVQKFTSVAVIVYVLGDNPVKVPAGPCDPKLGLIVYVLAPVPPVYVTTI